MMRTELQKTVRKHLRVKISQNEYAFQNSANIQRRYRDTVRGKDSVKRSNNKVSDKLKLFNIVAKRLLNS